MVDWMYCLDGVWIIFMFSIMILLIIVLGIVFVCGVFVEVMV